jgi:hypothetical protein
VVATSLISLTPATSRAAPEGSSDAYTNRLPGSVASLAQAIRTRGVPVGQADADGFLREDFAARVVTIPPQAGGSILPLLRIVPTRRDTVKATDLGVFSGSAGAATYGTSLPTASGTPTISDADHRLERYGIAGITERDNLRDAGIFAATVDTLFRRSYAAGLARDVLTGNGTSPTPLGILNTPSLPPIRRVHDGGEGRRALSWCAACPRDRVRGAVGSGCLPGHDAFDPY